MSVGPRKSIGPKLWRQNGRKHLPKAEEPPADIGDLAGLAPEAQIRQLAPEAIEAIARILRRPGRHATAQLSAAREILAYGVDRRPAPAQDVNLNHNGKITILGELDAAIEAFDGLTK